MTPAAPPTAVIDIFALLPAVFSFVLTATVFPFYIKWLKGKQIEQFIREEGPQSHAAKAKTPTMGGLCIIAVSAAVAFACLGNIHSHTSLIGFVVIGIGACCGLVGFLDDFAKVTSKSNRGVSAKLRLLVEFGLGLVLVGILLCLRDKNLAEPLSFSHLVVGFKIAQPFTFHGLFIAGAPAWKAIDWTLCDPLVYLYGFFFVPFLVAATTNAVNLHDGMDGLAAGTTIQVFSLLAIIYCLAGHTPLAMVSSAVAGSLGGFLIYNHHPAKIFMGDTGSLFIGGVMAALIVAGGMTLWFVPLSVIYIAESISVMAQVSCFKLTKVYVPEAPMSPLALAWYKLTHRLPGEGKRLFRMAPLHHHFEAIAADHGVAEGVVVSQFWLAQLAICCLVCLAMLCLSMAGS